MFQDLAETFRKLTGQTPIFVESANEIHGLPQSIREACNAPFPDAEVALPLDPILISQADLLQEYIVPVAVGKKPLGFLRSGCFLVTGNVPVQDLPKSWPSHTPRCAPERFEAVGKLLALMAEVISSRLRENGHDLGSGVPSPVKRAVAIIRQQSRENLTLGAVGREVGVSANYLTEMLSKHTGRSFRRHLTECRVEDAQNLLRSTKLTIGEIAFAVGFQSLSQFNRSFRAMAKASPSQYRKQIRAASQEDSLPQNVFP